MADTSLDDFFAKKDNRKKSKKKFTTTEQIAKKLEESGKKSSTEMASKKEKEKPAPTMNPPTSISQVTDQAASLVLKEDDEWRDFEEEKEKDYSGLKIHNFQMSEGAKDDEFERDRIIELDEDGEQIKPREKDTGPWNNRDHHHRSGGATVGHVSPPPTPAPVIEKKEDREDKSGGGGNTQGGVYRPPHARTSGGSSSSASKNKLSKNAPEISSELHFPSLSASADNPPKSKKSEWESERGFESVKRGSRTSEEVVCRGPKLDLGNKYNALSQSDMS